MRVAVWRAAVLVVAGFMVSGTPARADSTLLVGKLTRQHLKACGKDHKERWVAPHLQVGFIRVVPSVGLRLAPLVGKIVAVSGKALASPTLAPPAHLSLENCPVRQMRSDWVEAKGGTRVKGPRPGQLGRVEELYAEQATAVKLLWLDRRGKMVRVRVRNGFKVPLKGLALHARYERCIGTKRKLLPGKPMPASVTRKLGTLAPGKSRIVTLPVVRSVVPRFKKTHALREVYLYSAESRALVDLSKELPVGLDRTCR